MGRKDALNLYYHPRMNLIIENLRIKIVSKILCDESEKNWLRIWLGPNGARSLPEYKESERKENPKYPQNWGVTWTFSSIFLLLEASGNFLIHREDMIAICREKVSLCWYYSFFFIVPEGGRFFSPQNQKKKKFSSS